MNPYEILRHFQGRQQPIIDAIKAIVDIESPSFNIEQSKKVVGWIEQQLNSISADFEVERMPADGSGEHLIVRTFPSAKEPVLILGHTDTVHAVGSNKKNPTRIEGDRFYGCGIFDMKANIVLMLEALRFFVVSGLSPSRPITILLSCDEEVGSRTGREPVERAAAKAALAFVFEPSFEGNVKTGRKGTGVYTLKTKGIPAHAGLEPEKGASAILEMARQIEKIEALNDLSAGTTVNVTTIKGGTTSNVIAEHAECEIDVRFAKMSEAERVADQMANLKSFDGRVSVELEGGINRPPMERTDAVISLFEHARRVADSFGYRLGETQVGGASDGNFVGAMGVPVLDGLGIAGAGAHTLEEHILIDDIAKRATLVTLLLSETLDD